MLVWKRGLAGRKRAAITVTCMFFFVDFSLNYCYINNQCLGIIIRWVSVKNWAALSHISCIIFKVVKMRCCDITRENIWIGKICIKYTNNVLYCWKTIGFWTNQIQLLKNTWHPFHTQAKPIRIGRRPYWYSRIRWYHSSTLSFPLQHKASAI